MATLSSRKESLGKCLYSFAVARMLEGSIVDHFEKIHAQISRSAVCAVAQKQSLLPEQTGDWGGSLVHVH